MRNRGHSRTPDPLLHTRTRYSEPGPPHPHVDPLFRTWATPPTCGTAGLHAEQGVYVRNRGSTCGTGGTAVHQTRYITREPAIPSLGLLIRTWTRYSEPGQHRPHAEQRVNMRNRGFTCGTATGGPAWGRPSCMPARRSRALWHCASATQVGGGVSGGHVLGEGDEVCRRFRVGGAHERRARKDEGRDGRQGAVTRLG